MEGGGLQPWRWRGAGMGEGRAGQKDGQRDPRPPQVLHGGRGLPVPPPPDGPAVRPGAARLLLRPPRPLHLRGRASHGTRTRPPPAPGECPQPGTMHGDTVHHAWPSPCPVYDPPCARLSPSPQGAVRAEVPQDCPQQRPGEPAGRKVRQRPQRSPRRAPQPRAPLRRSRQQPPKVSAGGRWGHGGVQRGSGAELGAVPSPTWSRCCGTGLGAW